MKRNCDDNNLLISHWSLGASRRKNKQMPENLGNIFAEGNASLPAVAFISGHLVRHGKCILQYENKNLWLA